MLFTNDDIINQIWDCVLNAECETLRVVLCLCGRARHSSIAYYTLPVPSIPYNIEHSYTFNYQSVTTFLTVARPDFTLPEPLSKVGSRIDLAPSNRQSATRPFDRTLSATLSPVLGAFGPAAAPRDPVLQQGCGRVILVDFGSFLTPDFLTIVKNNMMKASKISLLFPILSDSSISLLKAAIFFYLPSRSYDLHYSTMSSIPSLHRSAMPILPRLSSHPYRHAPDPLADPNF